jgi:hypothetical protein
MSGENFFGMCKHFPFGIENPKGKRTERGKLLIFLLGLHWSLTVFNTKVVR